MQELFKNEIMSAICIGIFYLFYLIFFKNETFFKINRELILLLISFSLVAPVLNIELSDSLLPYTPSMIVVPANSNNNISSSEKANIDKINNNQKYSLKEFNHSTLLTLLGILYSLGIGFSLLLMIFNICKILILKRKLEVRYINEIKCYVSPEKYGSFSFLNMIFISEKAFENCEENEILNHELMHIKDLHSYDLIVISLIKSIQWFNPFIYLFEKELKVVHEYIADNKSSQYCINSYEKKDNDNKTLNNKYIDILLRQIIGVQLSDLTNNFNSKALKRRLKMLVKEKSSKMRLWRYGWLMLPIIFCLLLFSCNKKFNIQTYTLKYPPLSTTEIQSKYDKQAEPLMGYNEYFELIKSIQRMPDEAKKNNISAEVMIAFYVNEDGTMSDISYVNGKIAGQKWTNHAIGYGLDDEAFRITKILSEKVKWNPAEYDKKPIKMIQYVYFDFGDKNVWDMYSAGASIVYTDSRSDHEYSFTNPCIREDETKPSFFTEKHFNQLCYNIKYPKAAINAKQSGKVVISFEINEQGLTKNARVEQGAGYGFDEEALRVVRNLKELIVKGFDHNGKRYNITIGFKFEQQRCYTIYPGNCKRFNRSAFLGVYEGNSEFNLLSGVDS